MANLIKLGLLVLAVYGVYQGVKTVIRLASELLA